MPKYSEWIMDNVYLYVRMELEKKYPNMQFIRYQMDIENQDTPILNIFVDYHDTKAKLFSFDLELADKTQRVIIISGQEVKKNKSYYNLILSIKGDKYLIPLIKKVCELACDYLNDPMKLNCADSNRMTPWKTTWPDTNNYEHSPYLSIEGLPLPDQELPEQKDLRLKNVAIACENIWVKMTLQDPPDTSKPYFDGHLKGILSKDILPDGNLKLIFEQFSLEQIYKELNRLYPPSSGTINLALNNSKPLPSDRSRKEPIPSSESINSRKRGTPLPTLAAYTPLTFFKDKSPSIKPPAPQQDNYGLFLEDDASDQSSVKRPKTQIEAPLNRTPTQKPSASVIKAVPKNISTPASAKSSPVIPAIPKNQLKLPATNVSFVPLPKESLRIVDKAIKESKERIEEKKSAKERERGDVNYSFS